MESEVRPTGVQLKMKAKLLNFNVTKFHKILIKTIRLRERVSMVVRYIRIDVRTYGWTGITLNVPPIVMAGA